MFSPGGFDRSAIDRHYRAMLRCLLGFLCLSTVACAAKEDDGPPSVEGKSAEEAAEVATQEVCEFADRCGRISIACADCAGEGECGGCFAEHFAIAYDECTMEVSIDFANGFACDEEMVTAEELALVDECLQALETFACPTIEAAEAWADGGPGEDPRAPKACEVLEDIQYRCFEMGEPQESDGMMPTPITG